MLAAEDAMIVREEERERSRKGLGRKKKKKRQEGKTGYVVLCIERATSGDPEVFDIKGEDE